MSALILDLYLCQPVLVARTEPGDENSAEGLSYIPGSTIRGALIAHRLNQMGRARFDLQTNGTERRWFFEDQVFLNAYPRHPNGQRMLPTPLSWRVEKDLRTAPGATVADLAAGSGKVMIQPVSLVEPFYCMDAAPERPQLLNPARFMEIHNSGWKRRIKGEGDSQVFRYEALAAGQIFTAVVLGADVKRFQDELSIQEGMLFSIGRSRDAHYGRVEVHSVRVEEGWAEAPGLDSTQKNGEPGKRLALILTSDAILYDKNGQPTLNLDAETGTPAEEAWYRTRLIGGFNRAWKQPLPQALALQAGSVFVYSPGVLSQKTIDRLVREGVGARRVEGYGRLRAAWLIPEMQREDIPYAVQNADVEKEKPFELKESQEMAEMIGEQYLRRLLEKKLAAAVSNLSIVNLQDRAQLSRLRIVVRTAIEQDDLSLISNHLVDLKSSAEKISQARVVQSAPSKTGPRLDDWIRSLIKEGITAEFWKPEEPEQWVWQSLLSPSEVEKQNMIGILPGDEKRQQLKRFYIGRLIDGVLHKATRQMQQQQRAMLEEEEAHGHR